MRGAKGGRGLQELEKRMLIRLKKILPFSGGDFFYFSTDEYR